MSDRLLVLTWHNVHGTWCFPAASGAGPRGLARQLALCRRMANVVSLERAARDLAEGRPLPPRAVALTFDDGYRDSLDVAVPLLRRLGLPATFFLVPGLLDGAVLPWWETVAWTFQRASVDTVTFQGQTYSLRGQAERVRAARQVTELLKRPDARSRAALIGELRDSCRPAGDPPGRELFLDWDGAREVAGAGFGIGSHTLAHDILAREDPDTQQADLARSRHDLEDGLQLPVRHLAYPNGKLGDYDDATIAAAADAGYQAAWTTLAGRNAPDTPPFELRRFMVDAKRGTAAFPLLPAQLRRPRTSWGRPTLPGQDGYARAAG